MDFDGNLVTRWWSGQSFWLRVRRFMVQSRLEELLLKIEKILVSCGLIAYCIPLRSAISICKYHTKAKKFTTTSSNGLEVIDNQREMKHKWFSIITFYEYFYSRGNFGLTQAPMFQRNYKHKTHLDNSAVVENMDYAYWNLFFWSDIGNT